MGHDPNYTSRPKRTYPVKVAKQTYDPARHCGYLKKTNGQHCTMLKGQGTLHLGEGHCKLHGGNSGDKIKTGIYSQIKRNRLQQLITKVRNSGSDPLDILGELEVLRALAMGFLEDHANLDDSDDVTRASDLMDKIIKAASQLQKMRQSDMIHIKLVELIHMRMADVLVRVISQLDPAAHEDWKQRAIEKIRDQWGMIQIETSPRELKKVFSQIADEGEIVEEDR